MPIVITPTGEYINSETGNPVNLPPQRPDFGSGSTSNREMSAMAGMMGQGGAISDEERRFLEETNRRMAPGMRPSGSGSTSDMEMRAMEEAMQDPNLRNLNIPPMGQQELQNMLTDPNMGMEGEMARENIPANMDMGMDSEMRAEDISDVDKVRMLIDMGLTPADAMEAVAREKISQVNPSAFGGRPQVENPGMGALSGVPTDGAMMPTPMPRPMQNPNSLERMRMEGRDRSFNPMDSIRPDNTPNT